MLGILLLIQICIFNYYWPSFSTKSWEFHIHYWLVSAWFVFLIIQPYLAVNGKIEKHRTYGIIGFLIAGGAIFTGFSLLDYPLRLIENMTLDRPGPPVAFYYGTLIVEFLLMVAFTYAILKGIIHRKNLKEHSWWLIASAFYMMMPAVGRGMIVFWRATLPPEKLNPLLITLSAEFIYIPMFLLFAHKFGKIKHQATLIGFLLVVVRVLRFPMGSSETVQEFLKLVIQF
jgi:hypothetical protein